MTLQSRLTAGLARQLGHPAGLAGRIVTGLLNHANRAMIDGAIAALPAGTGAIVADLGFGGGIGLRRMLDHPGVARVHGVEVSHTAIAAARRRYASELASERLRLHEASLTALPLADASLDGLITVNTIYFVADLDAALRELARTLTPSGRAVIAIGDPDAMAKLPFTQHGFHLRPIDELADAIQRSGLTLIEDRRVGAAPRAAHLLITTPAR